jgi:hypothetical protein
LRQSGCWIEVECSEDPLGIGDYVWVDGPCLDDMPELISGGVVYQNRLLFKQPIPLLLYISSCTVEYVYVAIPVSSSAHTTVKVADPEISFSRSRMSDELRRSEYPQAPVDDITHMQESYQNVWSKGIKGCIQAGSRECRLRGCGSGQDIVESWESDGESGQLGKGAGV